MRKGRKLVSPEMLFDAAEEVIAAAKRRRIRVALAGGFAMQSYGSDRLTGDVDFITNKLIQDFKTEKKLSFGGIRSHTSNGVEIDLIVRNDDFKELYREALREAITDKDLDMPVVQPHYLVPMKMIAGRSGKDDADIQFLLQEGLIDLAATRDVIRRHLGPYAVREFDLLIDEAAWLKSRR